MNTRTDISKYGDQEGVVALPGDYGSKLFTVQINISCSGGCEGTKSFSTITKPFLRYIRFIKDKGRTICLGKVGESYKLFLHMS